LEKDIPSDTDTVRMLLLKMFYSSFPCQELSQIFDSLPEVRHTFELEN